MTRLSLGSGLLVVLSRTLARAAEVAHTVRTTPSATRLVRPVPLSLGHSSRTRSPNTIELPNQRCSTRPEGPGMIGMMMVIRLYRGVGSMLMKLFGSAIPWDIEWEFGS